MNSVISMGNMHLKLVTPTIEKRTVTPRRQKNAALRTREYLIEHEIETLMAAARQNRYGHRDATMILIAFRHGLRASEAVDLRWDQVDFDRASLHVRRSKGGTPSVHPLSGSEMRALRRLQRESVGGAVCLRQRARRAVHDGRLCQTDGASGQQGRARP